MTLLSRSDECSKFSIRPAERDLLGYLLTEYPLVPLSHRRVVRNAQDDSHQEHQELLEQSMAESQRANQLEVKRFLDAATTWESKEDGFHVTLTNAQLEWLLQVLNDIRVGSWLKLGSPESLEELPAIPPNATSDLARYRFLMELSGMFVGFLVAVMDGEIQE